MRSCCCCAIIGLFYILLDLLSAPIQWIARDSCARTEHTWFTCGWMRVLLFTKDDLENRTTSQVQLTDGNNICPWIGWILIWFEIIWFRWNTGKLLIVEEHCHQWTEHTWPRELAKSTVADLICLNISFDIVQCNFFRHIWFCLEFTIIGLNTGNTITGQLFLLWLIFIVSCWFVRLLLCCVWQIAWRYLTWRWSLWRLREW